VNTLKAIRLALMRELETINHYQELHDLADDPSVKELMLHLMDEEKEHVAELTSTLRRFDPRQDDHFAGGHAAQLHADGTSPGIGAKAPTAAASPAAVPTKQQRPGLTVGSLIGLD
jgi:rubrerythrin